MWTMLRLDDFTANVAKSGLVPPEVMTQVQARSSIPQPADDAVGAAGTPADRRRLAHRPTRRASSSRGRPGAFSWGAIDCSAPWAKGAWEKSTWPSTTTRQQVAIKVLPPRKALEEENALRRFRREMELSQRCSHPNLARTLVGRQRGRRPFHGHGVHPRQEPVRARQERAGRSAARARRGPAVPQAARRARGGPPARAWSIAISSPRTS